MAASGDLGYTIGNYTLKTTDMNGVPVVEKGKFQTTWKKIDGAWKVIEDTATADAPAAGQPRGRSVEEIAASIAGSA